MDDIDIKLINLLQKGIPLEKDPYRVLADKIGITRSELLERIKVLFQDGYIRRIGGTFNNEMMGYKSILFGIQVPCEKLDIVAEYVNSFKAVTHNYQRSGMLNMWFTFSASDQEEKDDFTKGLRDGFGITQIMEFQNIRSYKLNVFFDMGGGALGRQSIY